MEPKYEVRQQVRTVNKRWLETVSSTTVERVAMDDYHRLIRENPNDYFEIVKVTHEEDCLAFTPQFEDDLEVGAGETAYKWICPRCKVDRFKEDCKGDRMTCPMVGIAHNAELRGRPLADGPA